MLQPRIVFSHHRRILASPSVLLPIQIQNVSYLSTYQSFTRTFTSALVFRRPAEPNPGPASDEVDVFVPKPLGRPIGFQNAPQAGENTTTPQSKKNYSNMTMRERNLEKRKDLVEKWGTNYFRDFKNIRKYRSGKTFLANPKIFKKEAALYFPNFHGETLAEKSADTTPVLQGKISVVNIYSSQWGEAQVQTFTGKKANAELHEALSQYRGVAQMVDLNIEENYMKAWIIALFQWRLRAARIKEDWGKYFIIRKGVSEKIRESIGLLNGRVGYVYLVDEQCKIRWAGSGNAEGTEMEDLNKGFKKLASEAQ